MCDNLPARRQAVNETRAPDATVPRTQRSAQPLRSGALLSRGRKEGSIRDGPGSAQQREERCSASGTRGAVPRALFLPAISNLPDAPYNLWIALAISKTSI
jgi:hypothetical protein